MDKESWIIYFAEDWGRHPSTSQYIAKELAQQYKILWINSLGLRSPRFTFSDIRRIITKLYDFIKSIIVKRSDSDHQAPPNVYILSPIAIPLLKYHSIRVINRFLVKKYLQHKFETLNILKPTVITAAIESVDIIDELGAVVKVYYCADEYSQIAGLDSQLVSSLELELFRKVDLVVTTSKKLQRIKNKLHPNVHYLPHGVDYEKFHLALNSQDDIPDELNDFQKPLIGFVGLLGEHINFNLIKLLAKNIPNATIVLIGPIEEGTNLPEGHSIKHIGPIPHDLVPRYLSQFDVCILPYANTSRNEFANPTKLREYLAAGCSVVSTFQAEATQLVKYVNFAKNEYEFINAVRSVLTTGGKLSREERSEAMRDHSWKSRADSLLKMISQQSRKDSL